MTQDQRPRPAWHTTPGPAVTSREATHGETRHDADGTQWWFDAAHGWQPVVYKPEPERNHEAGQ